jgi:hypothetical protein
MRTISALVVVIGLVTSACFGGGGSAASSTVPSTTQSSTGPTVDWTIRYSIGYGVAQQDKLPDGCPADSRCTPVELPGARNSAGKHLWVVEVTRRVSCPTGRGDVTPPADCAAINQLRKPLRNGRNMICDCAPMLGLRGSAIAHVHGHRIRMPLDFCTYCGSGQASVDALSTLKRTQ